MITFFIIRLLFIVHDKIIMLMGTWRTTRENSATTRVAWDALSLGKLVDDYLTRKGQGQ
jgi:NADH:ubiquinone oxidoreductase subunit 3 (subunit A)